MRVGEAGLDSGSAVGGRLSSFAPLVVEDLDVVLVALGEHGDIINVARLIDMT